MITAIYLSNRYVQVITGENRNGKIELSRTYETQVPEECLINGVITDENLLADYLGNFWKQNQLSKKDVSVVVNSSQMAYKVVELPRVKPDKIMEILRKEFSDSEVKQDPIYSYHVLQTDQKSMKILSTGAERSFVGSIVKLFEKIGVDISAVNTSMGSAVRFLEHIPSMKDKTCIVQFLDDNNLTNVLWIDGQYEYTSRSRLFNEHGTQAIGAEVARTVSHMQQFYASLKRDKPISDVYVAGMDVRDYEFYARELSQFGYEARGIQTDGQVSFDISPGDKKPGDFGLLLGSFYRQKADRNLLTSYRRKAGAEQEKAKLIGYVVPIGITLLICLAASAGVIGYNTLKQKEADALYTYLTDAENMEKSAEYDRLEKESASITRKINQSETLIQALASYPRTNDYVVGMIQLAGAGLADVKMESYDGETGSMTLKASAVQVEDINTFVGNLLKLDMIENVEYSGYSYEENKTVYNINVVCYLASDAGK